jgi:hypothetical protein
MNQGQRKVKEYMEKYELERVISGMVNAVVQAHDDKPLVFMVFASNC